MTERMIAQTTTHGNISPSEHKPSLTNCLAKPDYGYIQYFLSSGDENLFNADDVLKYLEDSYAKFGEILLVILGNEINLSHTYAHHAVVELCKRMDSDYYGVFENTQTYSDEHVPCRTVEFEGQTHYYCNYMAEALQQISEIGIDFYNIYGGQ